MLSGCAGSTAGADPLEAFVAGMPKAELHVHLEGTVAPAEALEIAARNGAPAPYESVAAFEAALNFDTLEAFLEAFHKTIAVLRTREDFYEITYRYLSKSHAQNVRYVDLKFDPQAHLRRGIEFDEFFGGILEAQQDAQRQHGIVSQLIMCFQRDATLASAELAYAQALKHRDHIVGIGLDNTEVLNFPAKFSELFGRARNDGFMLTAHCDLGQPNGVEHIRACIEDLRVNRLDHGYNILEDQRLVQIARAQQMCFTACPTSEFNTIDSAERYYFREVARSVKLMLELGLCVTVNTDDPGVMGNRFLSEVLLDTARYLDLERRQIVTLSENALSSLWVSGAQKQVYLDELAQYAKSHSISVG
ncbi:MAG: adenosine deaminase [Pseudomonadales bacterium]